MAEQRVMEAVIRIGGEMDKSVKMSMAKVGNSLTTLNKKCAAFEKAMLKAGAAIGVAFAAAAATAAVAFVKAGNDIVKSMNNISAQTGATGAELEELGNIARDVWKSGVGESFDEVSKALVNIKQASGLVGDELEKATKAAMVLKDTFGFEVNESTRAATAMMKNFGITAEEAYGLMTLGAQQGANKNGDLLDTLNEYSVHYKALGLSAEQFVTSLIEGAEAGSFSIDKVGDAVKEFNIRAKDGSKKTLEAYQALGLNGVEMTQAFAAGGDKAEEAFKTVVKALKNMKDPVKQNAAGIALFGTMFEDLEAGVLDTLGSMENASLDAKGALEHLNEVKYNDLFSTFEKIKRSLGAQLMPAAEKAARALNDAMPAIQAEIAKLEPVLASLGERFATALPGLIQGAVEKIPKLIKAFKDAYKWLSKNKDTIATIGKVVLGVYAAFRAFAVITGIIKGIAAAQWLWNAAMTANPIGIIIMAIAALVAAVIWLWNNWDKVVAWISGLWDKFAQKFPKTAAFLKQYWEVSCKALKAVWDWLCEAFTAAWDFVSEQFTQGWERMKFTWNFLCEALGSAWDAVCDGLSAAWDYVSDQFTQGWERMKFTWNFLCEALGSAWDAVCDGLSAAWDYVAGQFTQGWENLKMTWNYICGIFGSAWDAVCNGLTSAWDTVSGYFTSAIDWLGGLFTGLWDGIKSAFTSVFESIPAALKTPINAVINIINGAINAINGIGFTIPDWVPGLGGQRFEVNIPNIPQLAKGGFTQGVSIAGEAGTEAVISFDPAYRKQNQGYLMTAAEMLGMTAVPNTGSGSTTYNLGGLTFSPVIQTGDNVDRGSILEQFRACMPDLMDLIEQSLRERETHRYV